AAGFIVKWIGYMWGFYLDSLSYFVSAVLIAIITPREKIKDMKKDIQKTKEIIEKSIRRNVWNEIGEGFKYMFKKDTMKVVTSALFLLMAGTGSIFCIIIVFIQQAFGSITDVLGSFGVFLGVGLFGGTILFGKYGQKLSQISTIFVCFTLSGALISLFAFYAGQKPIFVIGAGLIMMVGMAAAPIFTCTNTLIHVLIPDNVRGRIFSSIEALMHLAFLVCMFITAYISKYINNGTILLISGIIFAAAGIVGQIISQKKLYLIKD
ncbi:MAG: MFS transporter, partial [Candidatus Omnitrophota bacterium]